MIVLRLVGVAGLLVAACRGSHSDREITQALPGRYLLSTGSLGQGRANGLVRDELDVGRDGLATHRCRFSDSRVAINESGAWEYKDGRFQMAKWTDCAGLFA